MPGIPQEKGTEGSAGGASAVGLNVYFSRIVAILVCSRWLPASTRCAISHGGPRTRQHSNRSARGVPTSGLTSQQWKQRHYAGPHVEHVRRMRQARQRWPFQAACIGVARKRCRPRAETGSRGALPLGGSGSVGAAATAGEYWPRKGGCLSHGNTRRSYYVLTCLVRKPMNRVRFCCPTVIVTVIWKPAQHLRLW